MPMHLRSLLVFLAIAVIAAVLAAGCTVTGPPSPPPGTTVGGAVPTATATVTTAATPSAPTTATPGSSTAPATSPTSPAATPSPLQTGDSGDAPSTEATSAVPTKAGSPTVTATATTTRTSGATPTAGITATATTFPRTVTVTPISTPPAGETYTELELKYLLLDHYGEDRFFFCDPDQYPISRGDEQEKALEAFPAIENDTAEFAAIVERTGLRPPYTDEAKLTIYREHKRLRAIPLDREAAGAYRYTISLGTEADGRRVSGTVRTDGTIREERSEVATLTCPICLAAGTRIATPAGPVKVEDLREGISVWTVDADGNRIAAPVLRTSRTRAPIGHEVVHLRLSDGREVTASPAHPLADGSPLGGLRSGDPLDGAVVMSAETVPYGGESTYDLLPTGPTGRYWADGVLLGSTLR